jgi:hypothetical protein
MGTVREPRGRETSAVGSRYRATASEDVTVDTSVYVYVCVCVHARAGSGELQSVVTCYIKESNKSDHQSKTRL